MKLPYISVFKIVMEGKASLRFLIGAIASLSFSIAVILCTIGLMDGFEKTLKFSLQQASGHIQIYRSDSFFFLTPDLEESLTRDSTNVLTPILQSEAFVLSENSAKGVLIKGVEPTSFKKVTGLNIELKPGQIVLGKELLQALEKPEKVEIVFGTGSKKNQGAPVLKSMAVSGIATHGIYEKDLRFAYVHIDELRKILEVKDNVINMISLRTSLETDMEKISYIVEQLQTQLPQYRVVPFWREFQTLLDAVKVEKFSISLILQIIVIVAIFNVVAFIFFISEKKAQDFFLLRALGLNVSTVSRFWLITTAWLWAISCVVSIGLANAFNYFLVHATFLDIPGDIYVLDKLRLDLTLDDYLQVFGLALIWIIFITVVSLFRLQKKSLLKGLRQEFT